MYVSAHVRALRSHSAPAQCPLLALSMPSQCPLSSPYVHVLALAYEVIYHKKLCVLSTCTMCYYFVKTDFIQSRCTHAWTCSNGTHVRLHAHAPWHARATLRLRAQRALALAGHQARA